MDFTHVLQPLHFLLPMHMCHKQCTYDVSKNKNRLVTLSQEEGKKTFLIIQIVLCSISY